MCVGGRLTAEELLNHAPVVIELASFTLESPFRVDWRNRGRSLFFLERDVNFPPGIGVDCSL